MLLSNLENTINILKIYNFKKDKYFSSITSNSKLTNNNTIFIYNKNTQTKKIYIEEALKNNIPAIITNKYHKFAQVPQFIVSNIDEETNLLLKNIYKHLPYKSIAITGTNGKTSVVWYVSKILKALNYNNSSVGTLGYFINNKKINDIELTTPAYEELYKYGCNNKREKNIFLFEASSHSLDQNRIRNFPVNIAAITNISNDHLDYHKNMREYKKAKIKLFTKHLSNKGYAIINSSIKDFSKLKKELNKKHIEIIEFGKKNIFFKMDKNIIKLNLNKKIYNLTNLKLRTTIELENLECAIACCLALGIKEKKIVNILSKINNPPGRLEKINFEKKNSKIIIDYAHTPDALKKILKSFKINKKKPVLLFGCGGERDKDKRSKMGIIAKNLSSKTYITDDNPRNENAAKIRKDIIKYCPNGIEIAGRKKAIFTAINNLNVNEVLIIAGKGHEKIQIIKNKKYKFDDLRLVKRIIKK